MKLRFTTAARRDIDEISAHVEFWTGDDRQADETLRQIIEQCQHLAELPGVPGRPRPELRPDLRSFPFRRYVIFFRYGEDELVVLNILSARRDIDGAVDGDDE